MADVLETDLQAWCEHLDAQTVWDRLAQGLIREERRHATSARFRRKLAIKKQHAGFLEDVANAATREASLRVGLEGLSYRRLEDVAERVSLLCSALEELETLSDLRNGTLERLFQAGDLIWQHSS